jgi:aryl-alcohol dehydrogenase-like predicted oxidoreductase
MHTRDPQDPTRRAVTLAIAAGLGASVVTPSFVTAAEALLRRAIPASGEMLPVIGLGTSGAFDVADSGADFDQASDALDAFSAGGGTLVDTSPMYGRAECALGLALAGKPYRDSLFLATKVWTRGRASGEAQFADSQRLLGRKKLDLEQVHNLQDTAVHLATLRAARERGELRYIGLTHYIASAHAELERRLPRDKPDFIQINYSIAEPEAGESLLKACADNGVAVLVNRPFADGAMFSHVKGRELPPVANELGCESSAQLFLKWILANTAVTCVLCGTRKRHHIVDNLAAAHGALPDAAQREAIAKWYRDA